MKKLFQDILKDKNNGHGRAEKMYKMDACPNAMPSLTLN